MKPFDFASSLGHGNSLGVVSPIKVVRYMFKLDFNKKFDKIARFKLRYILVFR